MVSRVSPDGPGDQAGIKVGDIILGVGGDGVRTQAEFYRKVWDRGAAGDRHPAAGAAGRRRQGARRSTRSTASSTSARRRRTESTPRADGARRAAPRECRGGIVIRRGIAPVECAGLLRTAAAASRAPFVDAPLRRHDLRQRVPAVPRAADRRQADPAVVRRLGRGLDDVPRVLPDRAARGLRVRRSRSCAACAPRTQVKLHVGAAGRQRSSLLPIVPGAHWKPAGRREPVVADPRAARGDDRPAVLPAVDDEPAGAGVVRAALPGASPYRLFALSNLASMLALARLSVPARAVGRRRAMQAWGWSAGYALFVGAVRRRGVVELERARNAVAASCRSATAERRGATPPSRRRPLARQALWCALAATGSLLLLAVSNHITQNIAAVPLLWIVPLRSTC